MKEKGELAKSRDKAVKSTKLTISDDDNVLVLDVDTVIPLRRVEDIPIELRRVERRFVGNTQSSEARNQDVAGSGSYLVGLEITDR